ncbi:fluoride efflux transporter CrcB [Cellulomonas xiejunii]|uniref:Fluoride-specific ion channel FluC n=1 Tax=Cellulomonas xiejunii TaxID=2968083 RepID=A0ABY5KTE2_9CELL|nr:fluoride efflux transporter CrcB [Cellulomonas xiejunii]MCC2314725.1 fluoride efflux transporter CrcB [Cellulomonas xiejunii]MCC2322987.1 fluoride efflux transporter CrcB [Cellulomonas xiejunii]UUI73484.1 fluoride efflux transporter CrcB [Cellulomonas xiejunii]
MTELLLLTLAGGLGAVVRYVVDAWIRTRTGSATFPWPTAIINLTGSLALGLLTGLIAGRLAPEALGAVLGTGFLGGYTTFSTASYELVQLVRKKQVGTALAYGVGVLVASVALAYLGLRWAADW